MVSCGVSGQMSTPQYFQACDRAVQAGFMTWAEIVDSTVEHYVHAFDTPYPEVNAKFAKYARQSLCLAVRREALRASPPAAMATTTTTRAPAADTALEFSFAFDPDSGSEDSQ